MSEEVDVSGNTGDGVTQLTPGVGQPLLVVPGMGLVLPPTATPGPNILEGGERVVPREGLGRGAPGLVEGLRLPGAPGGGQVE